MKQIKQNLSLLAIALIIIITLAPAHAQENETVTARDALDAIVDANELLEAMQEEGFNTTYVEDMLIAARREFQGENQSWLIEAYNNSTFEDKQNYLDVLLEAQEAYAAGKRYPNYAEAMTLTQSISERYDEAIVLSDELRALELKIIEYEGLGVNTSEANEFHEEAREAFHHERYEEVGGFIAEADEDLEDERAEITTLNVLRNASKSFLEMYWKYMVGLAILTLVVTAVTWVVTRRARARGKVKMLKIEESTMQNLMKKAQKEHFQDKTLPTTTYNLRIQKYREKLADVRSMIPVYEAIEKGERPKEKSGKEEKAEE